MHFEKSLGKGTFFIIEAIRGVKKIDNLQLSGVVKSFTLISKVCFLLRQTNFIT